MELWKGKKWGKEGGEEGFRVRPGLMGHPEMRTRRRNGFLGDAVASLGHHGNRSPRGDIQ